jgi:hypothetical protein
VFWRKKRPVETKAGNTLASPDALLLELFGALPATSGISVSPRNAMQCTPVRCAVQSIAEAIGQLPVQVYWGRALRTSI